MFSKACEYGIRATLHIAAQSLESNRVSLKQIAKAIDSPEAFTAKILQVLVKNNVIESIKGPNGGFEIAKAKIIKLRLSHIVTAIDGDSIYKGCGLGMKECNEKKPCPVHTNFKAIREGLKSMLETTSLYDLTIGLNKGKTFLS